MMPAFEVAHLAFLRLLRSHAVRYLVIGGFAVQLYGVNRETSNLDVWVGGDRQNLENLKAASSAHGYAEPQKIELLSTDAGLVLPVGQLDAPIELMAHLAGVDFESCYPHRSTLKVKGIHISFISREDLIAYKHAYGRPKDLADAERLAA
jgi:hypothetical protein